MNTSWRASCGNPKRELRSAAGIVCGNPETSGCPCWTPTGGYRPECRLNAPGYGVMQRS
jgi:hypothetical protein